MKLRRNEYCPIHRSLFCCGREHARKERRFQLGVQRIEDPHHPRGYRELRSPAEMRKLLNRKIVEQAGKCAICHHEFADCSDVVPDHTDSQKEWEARAETTIRTIFKPCIGGATPKRDPADRATDGLRQAGNYSLSSRTRGVKIMINVLASGEYPLDCFAAWELAALGGLA